MQCRVVTSLIETRRLLEIRRLLEYYSDGNKTKIVRPRPIKQQQDYIIEKTLLLQHACLLSKNNFVQKRQKVI